MKSLFFWTGDDQAENKVQVSTRKSRSCSAFSLLELILVIAFIGTIAAVSFPRLTPILRRVRLENCALRVQGVLSSGRRLARRYGGAVIHFDQQGGGIQWGENGRLKMIPFSIPQEVTLEIENRGEGGKIRFDRRGFCVPARIKLRLGRENVTLLLEPFLERVRMQ